MSGCKLKNSILKQGFNSIKLLLLLLLWMPAAMAQLPVRQDILLNNNWHSIIDEHDIKAHDGFEQAGFRDKSWTTVNVPHNWDTYQGYRRLKHGNLHGYAWYRKTFSVKPKAAEAKYFLYFEGVGSYATVWLNGKKVGYHAGGRTTFTIDVSRVIKLNQPNLLCVRADHPAFIQNLPWVCGGCSDDGGFSEGSQPMGIFRPVHLVVTNPVRVEPFGVHIWNDTTVTERSATLNLQTEVKNYSTKTAGINVVNRLVDAKGKVIATVQSRQTVQAAGSIKLAQQFKAVPGARLWSLQDPYLYTIHTQIWQNGKLTDEVKTPYGIRWISWPLGRNGDNRFYLNGKPVFINGNAEYEHLMGRSHAFTAEEIKARVMQLRAAGFNSFRDAHQPHNLRYQQYWDELGLLWWPQFTAHIWFDTPAFKENFKTLLRDWIRERRNSPSVILWGLQNESKLPAAFARECSDIIREMDPTASSQRKITTCNGGEGTDWNVPQNWTGTYGGNPLTYADDLQKQVLVGEYGAWRSLELHTDGPFNQNGPLSEDRMTELMETKVRLAESVKDKVAGQYHWLLYSHENPGRTQGGEGYRELDRIGPVNYKGLFTAWGEPTDAFYMYRANYAPKDKEPMVYVVSHTWPSRWLTPGLKDSINVYSNCDEVELFNDVKTESLGRQKRNGIGTHFMWNKINVRYNVLYAVGYVNGKAVAHDYIVLNHLPPAPHLQQITGDETLSLAPQAGHNYLYRVNCGGPEYKDSNGNLWLADRHQSGAQSWGSRSWTDDYPGMPAFFASQQRTFNPVGGTHDSPLFQTFRFGMDKLRYEFPLPDGEYEVELYFTEPWYGDGGSLNCKGWRTFDVAVNGQTCISNLDIWQEAGYNHAFKKTIMAKARGRKLVISFPQVIAGEAVISAIAISSTNTKLRVASSEDNDLIKSLSDQKSKVRSWLDIGDQLYSDAGIKISQLPPALYGADWLQTSSKDQPSSFTIGADGAVYIAMEATAQSRPQWLHDYEVTGLKLQTDYNGGQELNLYRKTYKKGGKVQLGTNVGSQMYAVMVLPAVTLAPATDLRKTVSYKADDAQAKGDGAVTDTVNNRKVLRFTKAAGGSAVFNVSPGVADLYALRIKYYNHTDKNLSAKMQLFAADGTLMKEETFTFKPVAKNKSGTINTNTGTSINAGNYRLVITAVNAEALSISGVEMQ